MLKSLNIQNFQSHKNTALKFDPGVNIFVGQSDSGKSSVFRVLKWGATNRPSGDAFRSWWGGETDVKIETENSKTVERRKGKGINEYIVEGHTFKALGTEVPDQVHDALNLTSVNWQGQHDAPFLLSESAGEVSRRLNEVADLSKIDEALSGVNRKMRENSAAFSVAAQQEREKQLALMEYEDVDTWANVTALLIEEESKAKELAATSAHGLDMLSEKLEAEQALVECKDVRGLSKLLQEIENKAQRARELKGESERLDQGLFNQAQFDASREMLNKRLKGVDGLILALQKKAVELKELNKSFDRLADIYEQLVENQNLLINKKLYLKEASNVFNEAFPSVCPLCGKEQ